MPATASEASPKAEPNSPALPDGQNRLTTSVTPLSYKLKLNIDPRSEQFSGETEIVVRLAAPTLRIDLHAVELELSVASAHGAGGLQNANIVYGANAGLALVFERPLSGDITLRMKYTSKLTEQPESLYRVHEDGAWYAFTQFEALMARRAFPCFDEPGIKTPFEVSITAPASMIAVSNTPLSKSMNSGAARTTFHFAPTKPLPTYLVAFAVGNFDVVEANIGTLPSRLLTTQGKGQQTAYAKEQTPAILGALTDYFGTPYPFAKLDQIAVPSFRAGAMENVGLVTYRESLLLLDPAKASQRDKLRSQSVIAHELAHMWFGNLVTMKWWDDLWLNEAFATWMSNRALTRVAPELEPELLAVGSMLDVMNMDALASATPIRKQIRGDGDIRNAFDWITYSKGFAVLRMLESWLGEKALQTGIRQYLKKHAWGNATMTDFVTAIEAASGKPIAQVTSGFVEQAGTPLVSVDLSCEGRKATVELSQQRYVPGGVRTTKGNSWSIPICLKLLGKKTQTECVLLSQPTQTIELKAGFCPSVVHPNAEEAGYYHWSLPASQFQALVTTHYHSLSLAERVALPSHAQALFESNQLPVANYLSILERAAQDPHRLVLKAVLGGLDLLRRTLPTGVHQEQLAPFVLKLLGARLKRIGLKAKPTDSPSDELLRASLVESYTRLTRDEGIVRAAQATTARFLKAPDSVLPQELQMLLPIAASRGDGTLHAALIAQFKQAKTPTRRNTLLFALASFTDAALLTKSYDLLLDGTFRATDFGTLRRAHRFSESMYQVFWKWFVTHEAELLKVLGVRHSQSLPWAAAGHCTSDGRARAAEHFDDLTRFGAGAAHNLSQALELSDRCVYMRGNQAAALGQALTSR